jgi:hypothetical protein
LGKIQAVMQQLLQQIDLDYYRSAQPLIVQPNSSNYAEYVRHRPTSRGEDIHALIMRRRKMWAALFATQRASPSESIGANLGALLDKLLVDFRVFFVGHGFSRPAFAIVAMMRASWPRLATVSNIDPSGGWPSSFVRGGQRIIVDNKAPFL